MQMTHSPPGAAEFFGGHVEHRRDGFPLRRKFSRRDLFQCCIRCGQELVQCRRDVLGLDDVEQRLVREIEKRVIQ